MNPPARPGHATLEGRQLSCQRGRRLLFEGLDISLPPGQRLPPDPAFSRSCSARPLMLRAICPNSSPRLNFSRVSSMSPAFRSASARVSCFSGRV